MSVLRTEKMSVAHRDHKCVAHRDHECVAHRDHECVAHTEIMTTIPLFFQPLIRLSILLPPYNSMLAAHLASMVHRDIGICPSTHCAPDPLRKCAPLRNAHPLRNLHNVGCSFVHCTCRQGRLILFLPSLIHLCSLQLKILVVHGALNARQEHLTLFLPSPNSPLQPATQNVGRTWCIIRKTGTPDPLPSIP